jgi:iron complex transport system permease protein
MTDRMIQLKRTLLNRRRRWVIVCTVLSVLAIGLSVTMLLAGNSFYSPKTVISVLSGVQVQGATFAIWQVRLPRLLAGVLVGFALGISGNAFQTMLRNPLASPDMIGISSGSSVAAVFCILVLGAGGVTASFASVFSGLLVAVMIYVLSSIRGFSGGKLILIGIGIQAMMKSVVSYLLLKAAANDVPSALRWLSGSLNGVQLKHIPLLAITIIPFGILVVLFGRQLKMLELGDSTATALGVRINLIRAVLVISVVIMIAFATAVTGPISCVTFLAGPIAARLIGERGAAMVPAGFIGIILVLASDLIGQYLLGTRFPVGIVTGILGAPYLLFLLINMNKKGSMS